MFEITPLEPGRFKVCIAGTEVTWTTYARDEDDCRTILRRQEKAWTQRLAGVKLARGEAMKRIERLRSVGRRAGA